MRSCAGASSACNVGRVVRLYVCPFHGVRCMLHGVRCMLHGVRCMLHGVRCMLHGALVSSGSLHLFQARQPHCMPTLSGCMLSVACGLGASWLLACRRVHALRCKLSPRFCLVHGACRLLSISRPAHPEVVVVLFAISRRVACPSMRICAHLSKHARTRTHAARAHRRARMRERAPAFPSGSLTRYRSALLLSKARFSSWSPSGPRHERMSSSMPRTLAI